VSARGYIYMIPPPAGVFEPPVSNYYRSNFQQFMTRLRYSGGIARTLDRELCRFANSFKR